MTDEPCANCHIGTLRPRQTTLTYWAGAQLVLIPNKQAWVCDVCADIVPEAGPIEQLEILLGVGLAFSVSTGRVREASLSPETLSWVALRRRSV